MTQSIGLSPADLQKVSDKFDLDNPALNLGTVLDFIREHNMDSVLRRDSSDEEKTRDPVEAEVLPNQDSAQSEDVISNNGSNQDAQFDSVEL